jgi:hypothetical protein
MRDVSYRTNIVTFDVSQSLGMMATGGAEGRLLIIDPYAYGISNGVMAHHDHEILGVYFYSEQHQIITVAEDRAICIWDAHKLERIQTIRDNQSTHVPKFTSCSFNEEKGLLYLGC